jgi:hypothetical protein
MKKILFGIISLVFIASTFSSCTIEKRIHQDGYHITWKHRHAAPLETDLSAENILVVEETLQTNYEIPQSNVHSVETISASSNQDNDLILTPKKNILVGSSIDTIVPNPTKQQEEYFSNNYTAPSRPSELQDIKLANWALGLGIGAISAPVWGLLLLALIVALAGATWSSINIWATLGIAFLAGGAIFITLEILAITFAIRFLRMHGKDPNYRKYRSRAITGLILASIYPALMVLNIIIGLAMI